MIGRPGPFQIVEDDGSGSVDTPMIPPRRRYSCEHYQACLDIAAALNWDNFTCRGCSSELNQSLLWQAAKKRKDDIVAKSICRVEPPTAIPGGHHLSGSTSQEIALIQTNICPPSACSAPLSSPILFCCAESTRSDTHITSRLKPESHSLASTNECENNSGATTSPLPTPIVNDDVEFISFSHPHSTK